MKSSDDLIPPTAPLSLPDWAGEQIRRAILFGGLQPGQRLVNAEWSARLGISQTPVREAFRRLSAEGYVEFDPQRGARVASFTHRDALDVYGLRILLEPRAVAASVAAADAAWVAQLGDAYRALHEAYESPVVLAPMDDAHRAFHRALRSACDSPWLLRIADMLADQSIRIQWASLGGRGGTRAARDEHREIYEAAAALDAERASLLTTHHLQRTLDALAAS